LLAFSPLPKRPIMQILILLLLCCFNFLSAKEADSPYITSERDTLALVDGVINAYNGKLVQIDQDIEIQSSDPLEMTRFYDGGHHFIAEFGYGIGCSYPALLHYFQTNDDKMYAAVELRMGCEILFKLKSNGKHHASGEVSKKHLESGYTNCCEALLHGEPSVYAMKLEMTREEAILDLGNGTKRYYSLL
jgi:hypothetical protein